MFIFGVKVNDLYSYTNPHQDDIVQISRTIRSNELLLEQLKFYQDTLELKKINNKKNIQNYINTISDNIVSMFKFCSIPIQTLLFAYRNPTELAANYALISYYYSNLKNNLVNSIESLSIVTTNHIKLQNIAVEIQNLNKQLQKDKKILIGYLNTKNNSVDASNQIIKTRKLLSKTDTLTFIMNQIVSNKLSTKDKIENTNFENIYKGNLSYVTNGILLSHFKATNPQDPNYNGITLLAQPNNSIVAPADGEIVFSDSFDHYDSLIIIKHSPSYFSIISGKYTSFVITTQLVKKDETIAINRSKNSTIYYELEKDNASVNPEKWLSKIKD